MMDKLKQPGIVLRQIILESASFEHAPDYLSVPPTPPPGELKVQMEVQYGLAADGNEGVIRLTVRTDPAHPGFYRFSVAMVAAVARQSGAENFSTLEYVESSAAALLFPFAREAVANITGRGRFGPTWLHPFNFTVGTRLPVPGETGESLPRASRTLVRKKRSTTAPGRPKRSK